MQVKKTLAADPNAKKTIHIGCAILGANVKSKRRDPGITVRFKGRRYTGHKVIIMGSSNVLHSEKPMAGGAHVYIETYSEVWVMEEAGTAPFSVDVLD